MKQLLVATSLLIALFSTTSVSAGAPKQSNVEVKRAIIRNSIASYYGRCPCPYSRAKNGSRCGKRSAYSRPGGVSPVCYSSDVTPEMMKQYKKRN